MTLRQLWSRWCLLSRVRTPSPSVDNVPLSNEVRSESLRRGRPAPPALKSVAIAGYKGSDHIGRSGTEAVRWVERAVAAASAEMLPGTGGLPARTRTVLAKSAASLASSLTRNSSILEKLDDLAAYHEFEEALRPQIASVHASMRLPHSNSSRNVRYDRLFVQPRILFVDGDDSVEVSNLDDVLAFSNRTVLLGDPGGGKSTSSSNSRMTLPRGRCRASVPVSHF